jgi:hypothetical protein
MPHVFLRAGAVIALAGLGLAIVGCHAVPAPPEPLTDAERAAIGETIRQLYRESSRTFDSDLDCEEIVERLAPGGQTGSFVAQGRLFELTSREELVQMCRAIKQNRLAAHEEIEEERVEVLSRDAAVLIARGVYTVQRRDGQTLVRPQVVTTVWARRNGEWRRVHLHESWQVGEQPASPAAEKK